MLLQTYSPPSLVDSVEEKPVEEIDEDDPDHEIDYDLPDLFMMTKCTVQTLCISVHHAFIVCIPSAFLGSVHNLQPGVVGVGVCQNWFPLKTLPPPLKNTWKTWQTNCSPPPP